MQYIECRQGEELWLSLRAGKVTASRVADALDILLRNSGHKKAGDPSDKSDLYCAEVSMEIINKGTFGKPASGWALERGHEMEDRAIIAYEERFNHMVTKAGVCISEDNRFLYSSDGLVNDDGLVEVKSPVNALKIQQMWETDDNSEYLYQCMTGLWITGRKWIDLIMYAPQLENEKADLYVQRILRDEEAIDEMVWRLHRFDKRVQETVKFFKSLKNRELPIILPKKQLPKPEGKQNATKEKNRRANA